MKTMLFVFATTILILESGCVKQDNTPCEASAASVLEQPKPCPEFAGKYKRAYEYLLEHPVKDKPNSWISAIIVKKVSNFGFPREAYTVRFLAITESGDYMLLREGYGSYGLDIDALFDIGDHFIHSGTQWGSNTFGLGDSNSKIIKKEAISFNDTPPKPAPVILPIEVEKGE